MLLQAKGQAAYPLHACPSRFRQVFLVVMLAGILGSYFFLIFTFGP